MLCSECSRSVKPVVALDIDGTLGDYHGHFVNFSLAYLGVNTVNGDHYDGAEPYKEWYCRVFSVDLTTFREVKLAYRQGGQKRTMQIYPEAASLTHGLGMNDVEIWVTTTRPYLRLDGVDRDTREWLRRNNIWYHHLLYDENKYDILAENIDKRRVVAVLDDETEQLRNAERALGAGCAILRRTPYNHAASWQGDTAVNLAVAYKLITNRLESWNVR